MKLVNLPSYRSMTSRCPLQIAVLAIVGTLGCTGSSVQQEPAVPRPVRAPIDTGTIYDSTSIRIAPLQLFRHGEVLYDYQTVSTVRVLAGDTIPRTDTTAVTAVLAFVFEEPGRDGLTIQARVRADSITLRTTSNGISTLPSQIDTVSINTVTGDKGTNDLPTASCTVESREKLIRFDEVLPNFPRNARGIWSDTLERQVCRAGIQLQGRRVAQYTLDSTVTPPQLLRTSVTTFTGHGMQWNQPVEVNGRSSSTDTLVLDLTRRRIEEVRGAAHLELNFRSQLRNQQFEQITRVAIRLR